MNLLLVLPIVIPLASAAVSMLVWRSRRTQRAIAVAASLGLLASAIVLLVSVRRVGMIVTEIGSWPAPFGIVLVADLLSALMILVSAIIVVATIIYSLTSIDARHERFGYYPLIMLLMMGVNGAFLTGDIFNLYVWFEVMLISSFVLMVLGAEREQIESGIKYVTLNLASSAFFLTGVGILYAVTGALNMADIARSLPNVTQPALVQAISVIFLVAFGIKAAVFPLFFWLPASYHTPPAAVSAIFAGLLTKVGVYALIRVFTLLFVQDPEFTHRLILVIAGLTMITGVLGAVAQNEFRRILSFHIISQIGYMIMGLGIFTRLALAASIFYVLHHIIVKANLFFVSGIVHRIRGTYDLKRLGGIQTLSPMLSLLFLVPAMSLAGVPPLSGFFAKLGLIRAGISAEEYLIVAAAVVTGFFTLFSMTKIWNEAFWKPAPEPRELPEWRGAARAMMVPVGALALLTILIGLGSGWLFSVSLEASDQILDQALYLRTVLP
ncbi:MAG TPA: Na+/H+ antiporter subunit D [Thermoanaerobaculia bacterium]|nr:Na+/H+ antiporter subunit D [Thermoanaerobaculia bacterium]